MKEYTKPSEVKLTKNLCVKRPGKRVIHVIGRQTSMYEYPAETADVDDEDEEIPAEAPPQKKKKLMADAMPKKSAPKPSAPKKSIAPKRTTKDIPATAKEKGTASRAFAAEEEDEDAPILTKLRPHLPLHNEALPIVEDMNKRRDAGLGKWRDIDPYAMRRRTVVDPRYHTREKQDFYETVLFDKSPAVNDMRYID
ncbi:hypothetical protein ZWY2020_008118 [Hordeum vulgare]|nr:hypothetical protein ZWY2020_008118 [Hordeum vulgare]